MPKDTIARLRIGSKHYEAVIDLDAALKIRKGTGGNAASALLANNIFYNSKDGSVASKADLEKAFGTSEISAIAERIIKRGELELPQEFRDEEREKRKKQIIDWYIKNSVDAKTGRPFAPGTISDALDQAGVKVDSKPIEEQISLISESLKKILPIKVETKKLSITVPAVYTGKVYGLLNEYKEKEEWLSNGSLKVAVSIPVGLQSEFYDKLNAITHGAALSEEIREKEAEAKGTRK